MALPDRPLSRKEEYLAKIAGQAGAQKPDYPMSRTEEYLDYIANNGGGGSSSFEILETTFDENTGDLTTIKTAQEIINDINAGKFVAIPVNMSSGGDTVLAQLIVGAIAVNEGGPVMVAGTFGGDGPAQFVFTADSLDDPFTANIGG